MRRMCPEGRSAHHLSNSRKPLLFEGVQDLAWRKACSELAQSRGVLKRLTSTLPEGRLHAVSRVSDTDHLAAAKLRGPLSRVYHDLVSAIGSGPGDSGLER